ncbi:MAG: tetratricopeptide repeat protein [Gemmatimonadota bacterium]|jgi:tetratricopeptide (TPR) repeat protein
MSPLKQLIHEIHRRSLWQVLGIFLAASWGVIEAVDLLTQQVGLPDWTPTMALVLLLIGLPIVLATAVVQEGMPGAGGREGSGGGDGREGSGSAGTDDSVSVGGQAGGAGALADPEPENLAAGTGSLDRPSTRPSQTKRLLTWKNAILGGVGAFTLLGFSIFAYFVMWTSGIGPVGNLVAQGVLEEKDPVVLADFDDATGKGVGEVVTEALRVDLLESPVLTIVTAGQLNRSLQLMDLPVETELTPELAREVALRGGFKAIIRGEVAPAGSAFVLSAAVVSAESGDELKAFRVTARSDDELVDAIDQLSQDIREGVGESLRNIRAGQPLEQATTSSFEALRDYTMAEQAEERGDYDEALRLLKEAVGLDSAFAMAYRKTAVLYSNLGTNPELGRAAVEQAYQYRSRLTDRERYLTEAYYHDHVTGDLAAVEAAYRNALRVAPDDGSALNNLALLLRRRGDYDEAIELLERAMNGPGASSVASWNLMAANVGAGNVEAAQAASQRYLASYPGHIYGTLARVYVANLRDDTDALHDMVRELRSAPPGAFRFMGAQAAGAQDIAAGRWREGTSHLGEAAEIAEMDGQPGVALGMRLGARVSAPVRLAGDTAGARRALRGLTREFEAVEAPDRPWLEFISAHLAVGDAASARSVYDRWPEEVPEEARGEGYPRDRREANIAILLGEGDAAGSAREAEALRRENRCSICVREPLARAYVEMGRTAEAIALLQEEQQGSNDPVWHPTDRMRATLLLGPLFEEVGDTAAALEQYQMIVDPWGDADSELQPAVRRARARIAGLAG